MISIPDIKLTEKCGVFSTLHVPVENPTPLTFEDLHQAYGFVLYRTTIKGGKSGWLKINGLRDYAIIYVNGTPIRSLDRRLRQDSLKLDLPKGDVRLDIFVENLGRINFGPYLLQNHKGITGTVTLGGRELKGWSIYSLPFDNPVVEQHSAPKAGEPVRLSGLFKLEEVGDTYLDMHEWGKGVVWVNGHNLGRYWQVGPQQTLLIPAEWLNKGQNQIEVLELIKTSQRKLKSIDHPILDELL